MFTKTTKEHKSVLMRTVALTEDNFSEMTHAPLHRPQSPASSYSSDQGSNKQRQTRQQPHVPALGLPSLGVKTDTEKAGKMEISDATRSVSSASTHLHHCHISWSQGCEVMQTSGPSAMFSKWMAFCQRGLAPSAAVSTLKSEGQRGDGVLGSEAQRRVKCGPFFLRLPVFGPFRRLREASRCHDATPACDATRANILR
ncbi:uncharacterized protein LOC119009022 isoform X2 [Acanthopagrus latus]|uniref:uncharacterized protein LOC119009022 isoform X2 n=1 Tax=Acanthopagrus latus TaxID=8177 RepID=UPI00187BD38D|nr:uncharacterized protein LOC119009022 isoform X2 [Acanthopagrus latus]